MLHLVSENNDPFNIRKDKILKLPKPTHLIYLHLSNPKYLFNDQTVNTAVKKPYNTKKQLTFKVVMDE